MRSRAVWLSGQVFVQLACVLLLAGCSHLDMDLEATGPAWGEGATTVQAESPSDVRARNLAQALAAWRARQDAGEADYSIGPGDVLEVAIFALEKPGETTTLTRTVGADGTITLPWVKAVHVAGVSAAQAEERIRAAYDGRFLKDPQVTLSVLEFNSRSVVITGAVARPGIYGLKTNQTTVLECLSLAGGLSRDAGSELLVMRGAADAEGAVGPEQNSITRVDLGLLLDEGNLVLNLPVGPGDIVTVPPRADEYVYVLGYVRRPGAYRLDRASRLDALRAVALGRGLMNTARASNSFLLRETPSGQQTIPVDLNKLARSEVPPLYLQPGDTLVVGTGFWGRVQEAVGPSMGASVSASANVAP